MSVEELKQILLTQIVPQYSRLGTVLGIYAQGSLVNGYTDSADFDVKVIWEQTIPENRERLAKQLNNNALQCLVVDYETVHLDRFHIDNQEYNLSHSVLEDFEKNVDLVIDGQVFLTNEIMQPIISVSGFFYGLTTIDKRGILSKNKEKLKQFPEKLKSETRRVFENRKESYLKDLEKYIERDGLYMFYKTLTEALEVFFIAWFVSYAIYFPGNKWLKQSIKKFKLNIRVESLLNKILGSDSDLKTKRQIFIELTKVLGT